MPQQQPTEFTHKFLYLVSEPHINGITAHPDKNFTGHQPLKNLHSWTQTHIQTPLKIHFIYLGNWEIYCTFKTCCIISILLSSKGCLFHKFILFCFYMFFLNNVLTFKYQPGHLKVKTDVMDSQPDNPTLGLYGHAQGVVMRH
jgi:hypothetical protein